MASAPTTERPLKNKRLSEGNRNTLYRFAIKQVEATENSEELDAAYDRAAQAVHDALVAFYPQKDMKVLQRYDAATSDACVYVSSGHYDYDRFCFREGDKRIPLRPGRSGGCNSRQPFLMEGNARADYEAFTDATKAAEKARAARLSDFKALIYGALTFNEVASVWPAAEALRESIVGTGTALRVMSEDVVARIQADAAFTLAEAA